MSISDPHATLDELKSRVRAFSRERDWEQFHNPKDLALALMCELGELVEHFRYRTNAQVTTHLADPEASRALAHELADCLWLILRLSDVCQIDLASALIEKLDLAALKYPVDQVRGRPDKYTAYTQPPQGTGTNQPDAGPRKDTLNDPPPAPH